MAKSNPQVTRAMVDARRKRPTFVVHESPSIITQYYRDINRLVLRMAALVRARVLPVLDKYNLQFAKTESGVRGLQVADDNFGLELMNAFRSIQGEFADLERYASQVATNRMTQANHANRRAFIASWKKTTGVNVGPLLSPSVRVSGRLIDGDSVAPVRQAIRNNIELIKSVPEKHLAKIEAAIEKGITTGDDSFSLRKIIEEINDQNTRRAKLIARDQLQKLNGVLVQARQQSLGIRGYIWRTSEDERVRQSHKDNDGKSFQWDSPPATGHPGEDINCRCVAEPDLSELVPSLAPELAKAGPRQRNRISV